jgi:putative tryptophan/tyrosine transport system substrate-binding protein
MHVTSTMARRKFVATLGGAAAAWPFAVRSQQAERLARIGYLGPTSASQLVGAIDAFSNGLRDLGYFKGRNLHVEFRFADGHEDRLPALAAELVALNVDVIVTFGTGVFAAQRATATIPIVAAVAPDLVSLGVVASLSHPGGHLTGLTFFLPELMAKRLELLKEVVPSMTRAGVLLLRDNPSTGSILEAMGVTAKALSVGLQPIEVRWPREFESEFSGWIEKQIDGLVILDHPDFLASFDTIAALAAEHRLPSIGALELPLSGGLMGYGVRFSEMFRRAAALVDKILKGSKPGDIPVEQASKFHLLLNLTSARTLGIEFPATLLATADEVLE